MCLLILEKVSIETKVSLVIFGMFCSNCWMSHLAWATHIIHRQMARVKGVNQCLEMFLRCSVYQAPKQWKKWLSQAELWYNTSYHILLSSVHPSRHFMGMIQKCASNITRWELYNRSSSKLGSRKRSLKWHPQDQPSSSPEQEQNSSRQAQNS
jgi:hypothetical protein